jgi:3-oxoadipate enol-lactonase
MDLHYADVTTHDGLALAYHTAGDPADPAILLLHGVGVDHRMWDAQIRPFSQPGYFVIVPDLRGHGQSQRPEQFSIEDCARDLADLLTGLHIDRAHVAGVSMGGLVAQQFTLDHSNRVGKLVLADSFSGINNPFERFSAGAALFILRFTPMRFQTHLLSDTYRAMDMPEVGAYMAACLQASPKAWMLAARKAVNAFSVSDRLGEIAAPTLVLVGDRFGQLAIRMARATAEGIPGAQFEILPGGGDPSNMLVPEAFNRSVLEFISRSPRIG